jgi:chemotaxis protein methyltransferase CheR
MILTSDVFGLITELIYQESGMYFSEIKIEFISRRVEKRMKELSMEDARDYYRYLKTDIFKKELKTLIENSITYETYFFRDYQQLRFFAEDILENILANKSVTDRTIRILSAGCSTGEEPYTLAIILREMLDNYKLWNIQIDAFDFSEELLNKAKNGFYSHRSVKETPSSYLFKYFKEDGNGYVLDDDVKNMVKFTQKNIYDSQSMNRINYYDIVYCRNVLIYFDQKSADVVLQNLHKSMKKNAYIFLGTAESLGRISTLFEMKKLKDSIVYQK